MSAAEDIIKWFENLNSERANYDVLNQQVVDYIAPHSGNIITQISPGQKKTDKIFDSTATYGSFVLSQFVQGTLFPQGQTWFSRARRSGGEVGSESAEWLKMSVRKTLALYKSTNFYNAVGQALNSWTNFGTGPILVEEVPATREGLASMRFTALPFGSYVLAEGLDGRVDTVIRCIKIKARTAVKMFEGANGVSRKTAELAEKEPFRDVEFLHSIMPREFTDYSRSKLRSSKDYPFASCWVEKEAKKLVKESGYRRFPVAVARYDLLPGEVYGRSPSHLALPDAKTLNMADQAEIKAWERELDQPLLIRQGSIVSDTLGTAAGGQTIVDDVGSVRPLYDKTNWHSSDLMRRRKEASILRMYHVNEILNLLAREQPQMTAFEVNARLTLLQQILGPVFGRLYSDFIYVIDDVVLDNMAESGALPQPPDELLNDADGLDVVLEGPMATAARHNEIVALQQSVADVGGISQLDNEVLLMVDFKKATRKLFEIRNTQDILIDEDEFAEKLEEMIERKNAAAAAALAGATAEGLGKVAPFVKVAKEQATTGGPGPL